ncbi:MAG: GNAT family N-acetyltransferase [Desemzia incerta]|uniref:GNAT family N-acetyltransferase n=1 Tax=Desemzia incerta TaxID=82801 RepID=UPI003314513A
MLIRKATYDDIKGLAKVNVDSWRTTYKNIVPDTYLDSMSYDLREKSFQKALDDEQVIVYLAEDEEVVGYIIGGKNREIEEFPAYEGELYALYILKEFHGRGIGKELVSKLFDELKAREIQHVMVKVLKDNPAKLFYQRLGAKYVDVTCFEISHSKLAEEVYGWENAPFNIEK